MDNYELSGTNSQKSFQCYVCKKHFSRKFTLDMHLLIHQGLKPHKCNVCHKSFRQKGTLMRHKALHSTTALFQCHLCNKAYRQKNVYLHHLKYTHKISSDIDNLEPKKHSTDNAQMGSQENETLHNISHFNTSHFLASNDSDRSLQDIILTDSVGEFSFSTAKSTPIKSQRSKITNPSKNQMYKAKYEKLSSGTDSYWRCDFCGVIMKYNYENCTRHVATHKKEFPFQCQGCSSLFFQKCDLVIHQTQCSAYQTSLQTSMPFARNIEEPSETVSKALSDVTFTCIPCQLDFQSEEDFECHVKTHVQSVLGDCSNPESSPDLPEIKFTPFFHGESNNLNFPSSSTMESNQKVCDPYECGNPYELINTVVAGANSVLSFMSNINNEERSNTDIRISNQMVPKSHQNPVIYKGISNVTKPGFNNDLNNFKRCALIRPSSENQDKTTQSKSNKEIMEISVTPILDRISLTAGPTLRSSLVRNVAVPKTVVEKRLSKSLNVEKVTTRKKGKEKASKIIKLSVKPEKEKIKLPKYKCKICKIKCKSQLQRECHLQKHMEFFNIKCTICNKQFLQKSQLSQHLRYVHYKKYRCPNKHCYKTFSYKALLEIHKRGCLLNNGNDFDGSLSFPSFAPVIDLSKLSFDNKEGILGIIPLSQKRPKSSDENGSFEVYPPRFGIPVLSVSSTRQGVQLPIVGEISLTK